MSSAGFLVDLTDALQRRDFPMTTPEFVEVLQEVSGSTSEPLTGGERAFLLADDDLTEEDLSPAAQTQALAVVVRGRIDAETTADSGSLTTAEVAKLLGREPSNVRRSVQHGDLYAPNRDSRQRRLFPSWQFTEGRPVPGLKRVLAALPPTMHPLSVEALMTSPAESLEERTPVEWLVSGGPVEAVVLLAEGAGYE